MCGTKQVADNAQPPPPPATSLPPFARNSETSRQAAIDKYDAETAGSQRELIYRLIRFMGARGATREEIQDKLELSGDTVRPRVCELLKAGLIKLAGMTRKTKCGKQAEVLVTI